MPKLKRRPLGYCPTCKDKSVKVKCYTRKRDGVRNRVEFCTNEGCGYSQELPFFEYKGGG